MSSEPRPPHSRPSLGKIIAWFALPLFFIIGFPLAYVSASHDPTPHDMPITIVGPSAVTTPIANSLSKGDEFSVAVSGQAADARGSVTSRASVGSVLIDIEMAADGTQTTTVTTYTASGAGRATTSVVQAVGDKIASQFDVANTVVDVAPLAKQDPLGSNLLYLLIFSSIGGYLVIITISELWGRSLRARLTGAAVAAVVTPPLVFFLSSIVVGTYGADAGTIAKLLLIDALYVFTCALAAILAEQLVGPAITMGVILLVVFLNFPSSGGTTAASLLPPFWQDVHSFWFGAGALETFRSLIYFDGAGSARWILQLAAWTFALLVIIAVIELGRSISVLRREVRTMQGVDTKAIDLAAAPRNLKPSTRIAGVIALPLFFIVSFVFAYLTALHSPTPNNMSVVIAGPQTVTTQVVDGVEAKADGAFHLTTTTNASTVKSAVADRQVEGAIAVEGRDVTVYIANGGGRLAASTVQSLGSQVAESLGGTVTVVDVAPVSDEDPTGTGLFYLIIASTVGGYLAINALFQTFPRARLRYQLAIVGVSAVVIPSVVIGVQSLFVGVFGASAGQAWAMWGIDVLYVFTVAMLATLLTRALRTASTFGVTIFLLALNFPSAGGAVSAGLLPSFWQFIHSFWFGAAALEAMRGVLYFNGAQVGQHLLVLGIWAVASTAAVLLLRLLQLRKKIPAEPTGDEIELVLPGTEAAAASL
ncbi:hypothetical protein [Leifsonia naganoensis]|uniref:DUF3533 domain-containing protein n=1 Tax=Leifsonia naganoensis TaxID=150025 RepID=A0A853DRH7_9MICO|nr:hypothetical protein [Leifsonia naganoensis]NYK09194.1 hypothetical protein [Leifsonia naganoensis]